MSGDLVIEPGRTALALVDLQNFTVKLPTVPFAGTEILANAVRLANRCRAVGILTVLVRASAGENNVLLLTPPVDRTMPSFTFPPGAHDIPAALGPKQGDVVVTKYNWGAFYGTDLDVQLRRRGIATIIVGGIATNFGVESTIRQAHERGYAQILASDVMAAFSLDEHEHPFNTIFPRIARIRTVAEILAAVG